MAKTGVKSKTIVHEIVMTLSLFPSFVVTRTTGPDSINVKALVIFSCFMCAFVALTGARLQIHGSHQARGFSESVTCMYGKVKALIPAVAGYCSSSTGCLCFETSCAWVCGGTGA